MSDEKELETWREEWRALGGKKDLTMELAARVKRDGRRIKRAAAFEVSSAIVSSSVFLWFAIASKGLPVYVALCAGGFLFNGIWLTRLFTLREGASKSLGEGLDLFVETTRRRFTDDLRWNAFARKATLALGLAIAPWSVWMLISAWPVYRAEPWRFAVGIGVVIIILSGVHLGLRKKRTKLTAERAHFESLVADRTLV